MRIGIFAGDVAAGGGTIDGVVQSAATAEKQGFSSYWLPQIFGFDALTTAAVIGREVDRIEIGTAVVPTYPRHPMMLAAQTLTVQAATGGRFSLGIGLSHQIVIEGMLGYSFDKPVRHMREYLSVLRPLLHGEAVSFTGETVSFNGALNIAEGSPAPILVAALGTQMLAVTGRLAEGTITWMTGPQTLAEHTVPTITAAAQEAGRDAPRIVSSLPVCVTSDPDDARSRAAEQFSVYGHLPSYRAMLDREGAAGPADVALVGDESTVRAGIGRLADAGVTDFVAAEFPASDDEAIATRDLLRSLL